LAKKTIEELMTQYHVTGNNRSCGIRERIKIQVWKRYRIILAHFTPRMLDMSFTATSRIKQIERQSRPCEENL